MANIVSILVSIASAYLVFLALVRTYNIAGIAEEIVEEEKKEKLLKPLRTFVVTGLAGLILNVIAFLLLPEMIKVVIGFITFVIVASSLYKIFDEIDSFDLSKKDSEILRDFLNDAQKDAKEKSK